MIRRDRKHAAEAYYHRAGAWGYKNEFDKAIADVSVAIWLDADYATFYILRGGLLLHEEEYDQALADFTDALRLDPHNAKAAEGVDTAKAGKALAEKGSNVPATDGSETD